MAGSPSPARTQLCFLGFHDPSGATGPLYGADDLASGSLSPCDAFGAPMIVRGVFLHVIETQSAHIETITLQWRPTPGSATGEVDLGTYVVPADTTAGTRLYKNFYTANPSAAATTIGSSEEYGIAGSARYVGGTDQIVGPGGEFQLSDVGSSTAGQYNVWLEVEFLSMENAAATVTTMA